MDIMGILLLICFILVNITDIRCKTTMGCNVTRGNLTCSDNNLIHVESVSFWLYSGDDCNDETRISCGTIKDNGLTPGCNGQTSCIETINKPPVCNGTTSTVFTYRCIYRDTSLIDMCDSIEGDAGNRFVLTSPGYPELSNNIKDECRCSIRGTNITSITVLDLRLVSATDGTISSLYIQYGDTTENISSRIDASKILYNYKLQLPPATTADIRFNSNQTYGKKFWFEIEGIALHVSCNNNTTSTSLSPPSLSSTPDSTILPSPTSITSSSKTTVPLSSSLQDSYSSTTMSSSTITGSTTVQASTNSSSTSTNLSSITTFSISSSLEDSYSSTTMSSSTITGSTTVYISTNSSPTSTNSTVPPQPDVSVSDNLTGIIAGAMVSGIIVLIVVVVVILCVKIQRKRTADPPRYVDVHVNVASNNYFVLEVPKDRDSLPLDAKVDLDYQESHLNIIKSDSSTNPRYSIVETGKAKNQDLSKLYKSDQKNKPVLNIKPVEDVEILQNDLYIPFQPSLVNKFPECKEPVQEKHNPPSDHENIKINQPSDVEIMENDLYVSYDNSTFKQPSDIKVSQPLDIKANQPSDVEIMENDLYVSYDNSTANQPSDVKVSQPSDIKTNQPSDIEIMENDLYVPFEKSK